ncbi:MAG TPA: phosphatidylserine decarboxylase family protein [Gemmatimonadales bacterium]|nr:phosphatidylserine decarboxylase family protein [Gemmatimonadales bacterium]
MAPEGWPFIAVGWGLAALGGWAALRWSGWWWVLESVVLVLALWLLVFFRNPERTGPRGDRYVIAPADGKIVSAIETDEPAFLHARALRISIFMSVFDVHVNRYPVSGTVAYRHYNAGQFLHAAADKASLDNEQASIGLEGPHGAVLVRQIAGLIARRIVTDAKVGDAATQGARLGMIRFGSRVDIYLPLTARPAPRVQVGDRVAAGATVLAEYTP